MSFIKKSVCTGFFCVLLILFTAVPRVHGITAKEEEDLAKEFLKMVHRELNIIEDPLTVQYINRLGNRLLSFFPQQPFPYRFYIVQQDVYNAFAGPGGHVFINSGLFAAMDTEEELAGILSHEISHVTCRHISDRIGRSGKINTVTMAGVLAGILLGVGGAGEAASALTVGSMAAGQSLSLAYSRDDERQADKVGLQHLYEAGYTGEGLLSVMKKIRSKQWYGSEDIPSYLTTHPASEERIVYIGNWVASHVQENQPDLPGDGLDFNRIRTRLMALYGDEQLMLRKFEANVRDNPGDFFFHYGYALALVRAGKHKDAIVQYRKALEQRAFDPYLPTDLGQAYFLDGQYQAALKILDSGNVAVDDPGRLFYLGRSQMETGQLTAAKTTFQKLLASFPKFADALYYLGETYGRMDVLDDAHYYRGMYHKEKRQMDKAVFHLKRALEKATDAEKKARIETELSQLKKDRKRQKKEEKKRS